MSEHTTELALDEALEMLLSAPAQARRSPRYHRAVEVLWAYLTGPGLKYVNGQFKNLSKDDLEDISLISFQHLYNTSATFQARRKGGAKAWLRTVLSNRAIDHHRKLKRREESSASETDDTDGEETDQITWETFNENEHFATDDVAREKASEKLHAVQKSYRIATQAYLESLSSARKDRQERERRIVEMHRALLMGEIELREWYDDNTASVTAERERKRARNALQAQVSRFRRGLKDFVMNDENGLSAEVCQSVYWTLENL